MGHALIILASMGTATLALVVGLLFVLFTGGVSE